MSDGCGDSNSGTKNKNKKINPPSPIRKVFNISGKPNDETSLNRYLRAGNCFAHNEPSIKKQGLKLSDP